MKSENQIQVELQDWMGSDRAIAEAAWTSSLTYSGKASRKDPDIERLVRMLAREGHSTPFESVVLRFWIKMPIQTDRQHMTHRIGSHNGMSGRYRTMPDEYLELAKDVKEIILKSFNGDVFKSDCVINQYDEICRKANGWYKNQLQHLKAAEKNQTITNTEYKRVREVLRGVLPQNNMTERVSIFNLRSFANYQKLRNSQHAQPEIQTVARLMLAEVEEKGVAPIAMSELKESGWKI